MIGSQLAARCRANLTNLLQEHYIICDNLTVLLTTIGQSSGKQGFKAINNTSISNCQGPQIAILQRWEIWAHNYLQIAVTTPIVIYKLQSSGIGTHF